MEKENILRHDTVSMDEQTGELVIIDQTRLPGETVFLRLSRPEEIHEAIYKLRVRGAPAIGVAAAIGIYAACRHLPEDSPAAFTAEFARIRDYLASARPTAVNLTWALNRMAKTAAAHAALSVDRAMDADQGIPCALSDILQRDSRRIDSLHRYTFFRWIRKRFLMAFIIITPSGKIKAF